MEQLYIDSNCIGRVKFFDLNKRFGFLESETHGDLFFSSNGVRDRTIQAGDEICFHVCNSRKYFDKLEATLIRRLYRSKDGFPVFDRINSHLHEEVLKFLNEIISQVQCGGREFIIEQFNFGKVIGKTILVAIGAEDKIIYAIRKGRLAHTKFVIGRQPVDCDCATIVLKKIDTGYLIITSYTGKIAEPEPWDKSASEESLTFWNSHALLFGHENIIEESLTEICPWVKSEVNGMLS